MDTVAYFADGPLHGSHAMLPSPVPEWNVVKPRDMHDMLMRPMSDDDRDPKLAITLTTGTYKRGKEPVVSHGNTAVWRYEWKGWQ